MEKAKIIIFNAAVIAVCIVVAYGLYRVFDAATHDVLDEIHLLGVNGAPLKDKIWLMELLVTFVFLAILTTHHFFEIVKTIRAAFDEKEVEETRLWLHVYGFCVIVFSSMALLIING